jgi:Nuclease-related domain
VSGSRRLKLRRADQCAVCDARLAAGTLAVWSAEAKAVTCLDCLKTDGLPAQPPSVLDGQSEERALNRGVPGASARRRYEGLHTRRERRARDRYGRLGGIYLALTSDPQSTIAWAQGSRGEQKLGQYLEGIQDESAVVILHDRRIPGTRANIDHIAITRSGTVWAIDAKNYRGRVKRIDRGGWFSTDLRLYVGRRDCSKRVLGVAKQVDAIRAALSASGTRELSVEVRAALCFVDAEWSLFAKPFGLGGVWIGWPRALADRLREAGELTQEQLASLARSVASAFPPA